MKKKFLVALLSLTLIVTMMPLAVFAQGNNSSATSTKKEGDLVKTKLGESNLYLVGEKEAKESSESFKKDGDYYVNEKTKTVSVDTPGWTITGDDKAYSLIVSEMKNGAKISLEKLVIANLDLEDKEQTTIFVPDGTQSEINERASLFADVILTGTGTIQVNGRGVDSTDTDLYVKGPTLDVVSTAESAAMIIDGNLNVEAGAVIAEGPAAPENLIGLSVHGTLQVAEGATVFGSGSAYGIAYKKGNYLNNFYGSKEKLDYDSRDEVTTLAKEKDVQFPGVDMKTFEVEGANAKTVYHGTFETPLGGSNFSLVGNRPAVESESEETKDGDYFVADSENYVQIDKPGWTLTGEDNSYEVVISDMDGTAKIELKAFRTPNLETLDMDETTIYVAKGQKAEISEYLSLANKVNLTGEGKIEVNGKGVTGTHLDLNIDGTTLDIIKSVDEGGVAMLVDGNVNVKSGGLLVENAVLADNQIGLLVSGKLNVANKAELFASASEYGIGYGRDSKIDTTKFLGSNEAVDYTRADEVTSPTSQKEVELKGKEFYTLAVDAANDLTNAKAVYHAKGEADTCRVEIRSSLGYPIEVQNVKKGDCAVEPKVPTVKGYQFDGWSTIDKEGKEHSFTFDMPITEDITIYANMAKLHTVAYMDGDTLYTTQKVADGHYTEPPTAPEKEGYKFNGWFTTPDAAGSGFDFENTPITEDTTLYADWIEVQPELRHDVSFLVDGELYCFESVPDGGQVSPPTVDPTKEGYEFTGWYLNKDGKGTAFDFDTPITKDTTLYAGWASKDKPNPNPPINHDKTGKAKGGITTGDNNMVILFAGLGAVAIGTALVIGLRRRRNHK